MSRYVLDPLYLESGQRQCLPLGGKARNDGSGGRRSVSGRRFSPDVPPVRSGTRIQPEESDRTAAFRARILTRARRISDSCREIVEFPRGDANLGRVIPSEEEKRGETSRANRRLSRQRRVCSILSIFTRRLHLWDLGNSKRLRKVSGDGRGRDDPLFLHAFIVDRTAFCRISFNRGRRSSLEKLRLDLTYSTKVDIVWVIYKCMYWAVRVCNRVKHVENEVYDTYISTKIEHDY